MKRKASNSRQMALPFLKPPCQHHSQFVTMAVVPAGLVCFDCGMLLLQYLPESPEQLGYVSADWAWKYVHGREWTTK